MFSLWRTIIHDLKATRSCFCDVRNRSTRWCYSALERENDDRGICNVPEDQRGSEMTDEEKLRLIARGIAPATGRSLKDIAVEIWEYNPSPAGPDHRSGAKLMKRPLKGPLYASWYPPPASANPFNQFRLTAKQMRWREKLKLLRAAGKGPPKKGAGKRSK